MPRSVAPTQTEVRFQAQVVELARINGYDTYHTFNSRRSQAGWPDLAIYGHRRYLMVELKAEKGHLSLAQRSTIAKLRAAGVDVRVWRPSQWNEIVATLTRPKAPK